MNRQSDAALKDLDELENIIARTKSLAATAGYEILARLEHADNEDVVQNGYFLIDDKNLSDMHWQIQSNFEEMETLRARSWRAFCEVTNPGNGA